MSTSTLQNFIGDFYSRRLLLIHTATATTTTTTLASPPPPAAVVSGDPYAGGDNTFDTNVVMVLSVLLCALICSLGLNSIIRCALRCSTLVSSRHGGAGAGANSGMKRKALKAFTTVSYSPEMKLPGLDVECVICLSEFAAGERVRLLPRCHHGFHVRCIDKWLSSHSSCPTCRDCLIETCQKIVGATATCSVPAASSSEIPPPLTAAPVVAQEAHVVNIILPLEPEGLIRNYHN